MSIGAVFYDYIKSIDFHRSADLVITASEDDSRRLYDVANAKLLKTTYHNNHATDRICFTHHLNSLICSSRYNLDSIGEFLRYLSMYDNRCLGIFKGHKERIEATFTPDGKYVISGLGNGTLHDWSINTGTKVGSWDSDIGVVSCLKWAPRRTMFAAAVSSVLTFWIDNQT